MTHLWVPVFLGEPLFTPVLLESSQILHFSGYFIFSKVLGFPGCLAVNNLPASAGDLVRSLGWEVPQVEEMVTHFRQCSCLKNPHGQTNLVGYCPWVAKSRAQLSDQHCDTIVKSGEGMWKQTEDSCKKHGLGRRHRVWLLIGMRRGKREGRGDQSWFRRQDSEDGTATGLKKLKARSVWE